MKIIEIINDCTLVGAGLITIETPFASRSLLGFFYQKERREIWIDILFLNLQIGVK